MTRAWPANKRGAAERREERGPGGDAPTKLTQKAYLRFRVPPLVAADDELLAALVPVGTAVEADELELGFAAVLAALNAAKSKLDAIPPADFDEFMRAIDMYAGLKRTFRKCGAQVTTNASLKMHELIAQEDLLRCDAGPARVFCDAELPGAFIAAINHHMATVCPGQPYDWVASSYYPAAAASAGDSTILGDQYGLYAANREHWLMGPRPNALPPGAPDTSGDLTDPGAVAALAEAAHERYPAGGGRASGASLYTSDAGVDVSGDYNRQEETTSLLNYGQVLCGLLSLAPGGCLVTKQYTFARPFSRGLLALLAALFDAVHVAKPLTSRPVNSEVYIVAQGYRGVGAELAGALLERLDAYRVAQQKAGGATPCDLGPLLDPALTRGAEEALLRAAEKLWLKQQVDFVEEAAALWAAYAGRVGALRDRLHSAADAEQRRWLKANPVRALAKADWLPSAEA